MSTDFQENGRDSETEQFGAATAVHDVAPTETLVASAVGDQCVNCGHTLLSDQRYCVVCGERRGAPRFTLPAPTAATEAMTAASSPSSGRGGSRSSRFGSPTTLVAGVGTLLLALLVGFLIGSAASKNNTKTVSQVPPVIKVVNTGGGSASSGAATTPSSSSRTSASHKSKAKGSSSKISKKQSSAESNAASKVLGGNNAPPANTKVGQKCSGSACNKPGFNKKTHKFDGSFFGQ